MSSSTIYASYNKTVIPLDELKVPILDRAFFFGDAVYEVIRVYGGKPFLFESHMTRLGNSLSEMGIHHVRDQRVEILENIAKNQINEGMVYLQISRGSGHRAHSFHGQALEPNILIYSKPFHEHPAEKEAKKGIYAITHDDVRSGHCNIKSVNLLANCLALSPRTSANGRTRSHFHP